jgi:hypothetical protein
LLLHPKKLAQFSHLFLKNIPVLDIKPFKAEQTFILCPHPVRLTPERFTPSIKTCPQKKKLALKKNFDLPKNKLGILSAILFHTD